MSDTPRTDSVVAPFIGSDTVTVEECSALLDIARQLERELAARVAELEGQVETLKAERNAAGMRERNQLLQKVQRLEEAGDAVVAVLRESEDQDFCDWIDKAYDAESKWNQAKETKP